MKESSIDLKLQERIALGNDEEVAIAIDELDRALQKAISTLQTVRHLQLEMAFRELEVNFPKNGIDYYRVTKMYKEHLIKQALRQSKGHQTKAAKLLNIGVSTLNMIIKRLGI